MSYVHRRRRGGDAARATRACSSCSRARPIRARRARSCCRRSTERGFVVGEDVFLAFSPERVDPGNPVYAHEEHAEGRRRHHAGCTESATALYADAASTRIVPVSSHRGGGAGEAAREHVPLGQHRARQRDGDRLRQAGRRRLGGDRRGGDEAVRLHEVHAGPGHRRPLHPARSALPRVEDADAQLQDALHRPGERDQQPRCRRSSSRRWRRR